MASLRNLLALSAAFLSIVSAQGIPASQCNTGPVQCCLTAGYVSSPQIATVLNTLHIVVSDLSVLLGLTCSPITVAGVGSGASCNALPLCCADNSHGGIVSIGCSPVNLNL